MAKPTARWGSLPFAEQIAFFKDKTNLPTERWQDLLGAAHDRAFVVAGAMKADLLADLHAAVLKGIEQGTTLETFREDFQAIVAKRGWTGWTGEDSPEGVAWRTKTIYGTNLRTSYQAGRHAQAQAIAHRRPFWRYVHNATVMDPRPEHLAWHGTVLRADNPWWDKHFVPNGWGCRCRIETLSQRDLDRLGKSGPDPTPDDGTYEWLDKRTGQTHTIPKGIDPGWDYTPGATRDLIAEVKAKAAGLPPQLGEALAAEVAKLADKPTARVFEAQKTAKAAAQWAMDNDIADFADYTGVKPEVANAWNASLFEHVTQFPELRQDQKFAGSAQAQFKQYRTISIDRLMLRLKTIYPELDEATLRARAERAVKIKRVSGDTYAHSWDQHDVRGVAVNKQWGSDPEGFTNHLKQDVIQNWHPQGTDSIKAVVDHELGHQLDTLLDLHKDAAMLALWAKGKPFVSENLSRYAMKNIKEMIAEGWAEYRNNPQPRAMAKQIGEIVESRYRHRYPA
jgi:hypothetical protein